MQTSQHKDPSDSTRLFVMEEMAEATRAILTATEKLSKENTKEIKETMSSLVSRLETLEGAENRRQGATASTKLWITIMGLFVAAVNVIVLLLLR